VLLSAQCTDERVNQVTPALFVLGNTASDMQHVDVEEIYKIVRPCGLAPQKSKAISNLSKILVDQYNGEVPEDMAALETLPGVGHKTASVVMSQGFGHPAFPVDTHIHRLAQRWGLTKGNSVTQTERDLKKLFPKQHWNKLHLQIIFYGREFCSARGCDGRVCDICTSCYPNRKKPFKHNKA
jgi:endonuclease-3